MSLNRGHLLIPAPAAVTLPDRDASTRRFEHRGSFQMPLEGPYRRCPICRSKFAQLPKHLDRVHHVLNQAERKILLAFAHGRVNVRGMDCPVQGCNYRGPRVDRHLSGGHRELDIKATNDHLRRLQWRATIRALSELRSTEPTQPPAPDSLGEDGDVSSSPGTPQRTAPEPLSDEYHTHLRGALSTPQHRMNARSKLGRIRTLLSFVARGKPLNATWTFMHDVEKIHAFPQALKDKRRTITTIKVYLVNFSQFMDYFSDTPPRGSRLTRRRIRAVSRAVHHQEAPAKCKSLATATIPVVLGKLEAAPPTVQLRHRLYGYLACYLSAVYGHRPGVLTNMTVGELQEAIDDAEEGSPGFVINVRNHKTNRAFGAAQLFLTHAEFSWFVRWLSIWSTLTPPCKFLFFSSNQKRISKLTRFAQCAWTEMGLPGQLTMTDFHSAVATHARDAHSREVSFPGSCARTADRFYANQLTVEQLADIRSKFDRATAPQSSPGSGTSGDGSPRLPRQ
ncbi:PREDICTED: uncharacterized protein LOC106911668, partial [Poecilia mexicana]|uniref:uncharacterized protein LOC106911668 n=1 Tax=Poecilia mexicana TaxID=48701 RepID=UPI00072DA872